jgi:hypothetical protein
MVLGKHWSKITANKTDVKALVLVSNDTGYGIDLNKNKINQDSDCIPNRY